ncbi:hypothetical protein JK203_06580 [Gluconobacter cerinus]|uniref:hypothetical protein n=1 Tax=Gluconobacter cerinus TaxID=38307 RepID=UPI001B8B7FC0|nr:hypothetical protein [Gluconobacter cerinus]MBS1040513.1 hypothetical protein [Gluconobacter cerinus]MBS1047102.1 hypothetical protein [Gluconobacter cerinus]
MIALFQKTIALGVVGISLAACSPDAYTPEKAIAAAAADPTGVVGQFEMTVQRVGQQNNMVYLDSADNYRDPKTLIIAIHESTVNDLLQGTSQTAEQYFMHRHVQASGLAKRVLIGRLKADGTIGSTYYQTQVFIGGVEDIKILPSD